MCLKWINWREFFSVLYVVVITDSLPPRHLQSPSSPPREKNSVWLSTLVYFEKPSYRLPTTYILLILIFMAPLHLVFHHYYCVINSSFFLFCVLCLPLCKGVKVVFDGPKILKTKLQTVIFYPALVVWPWKLDIVWRENNLLLCSNTFQTRWIDHIIQNSSI